MTQSFTPNDLIRMIYGEADYSENAEFVDFLIRNDALRYELESVKDLLDQGFVNPAPSSIKYILDYNKSRPKLSVLNAFSMN